MLFAAGIVSLLWCTVTNVLVTATELRGSSADVAQRELQDAPVNPLDDLALVDARSDKQIPRYSYLLDQDDPTVLVDWNTLPSSQRLSVEALTVGSVGSIQWSLNGKIRTENAAPWALCGNRGKDFFACDEFRNGANVTVQATAFSGRDATGTKYPTRTVQFRFTRTVFDSGFYPLTLTLINAKTDLEIGQLTTGMVIDLTKTPKLNIRADQNGRTGSVQFRYDGEFVRVDNIEPFSFAGNQGNNYYEWVPTLGPHNITAINYGFDDAIGDEILGIYTKWFTVVRNPPGPPTLPPTRAPVRRLPTFMPTQEFDPPRLLDFKLLTPAIVNVASGPVAASIEVTAQDDGTAGYNYEFVAATRIVLGEGTTRIRSPDVDRARTLGKPVTSIVNLTFPAIVGNGDYDLELTLYDSVFNFLELSPQDLNALGFPSKLTVAGSWQPRLVESFTSAQEAPISVTAGNTLSFDLRLNRAVRSAELYLRFASLTSNGLFSAVYNETSGGKTVVQTLSIDRDFKIGTHFLELNLILGDGVFVTFDENDLAALGFPNNVTVVYPPRVVLS